MAYIDANQADDLPRNLAVGVAYKLINSEDTKVDHDRRVQQDDGWVERPAVG